MTYLANRFEAAVIALVTDAPIKQRLTRAYSDHLEGLREADLPRHISAAYCALQAALHRVPPVGNGTRVAASVQKMSGGEAAYYAEEIVKLYVELMRHGQRAEPLKVVEPADQRVPGYLAGNS